MSSLPPRHAAAPADADAFALRGEIGFGHGALAFGGTRRIASLAAVGDTRSITPATRVVGLSYKAAWDAIDGFAAARPLLERIGMLALSEGTTVTAMFKASGVIVGISE